MVATTDLGFGRVSTPRHPEHCASQGAMLRGREGQ